MSNPSFSNIDLWLFELTEGNLTPSQVEQLKTFLLLHPELDVDKDVWESARLKKSNVVYTRKESLKRDRPVLWFMDLASASVAGIGLILALIPMGDDTSTSLQMAHMDSRHNVSGINVALGTASTGTYKDRSRSVDKHNDQVFVASNGDGTHQVDYSQNDVVSDGITSASSQNRYNQPESNQNLNSFTANTNQNQREFIGNLNVKPVHTLNSNHSGEIVFADQISAISEEKSIEKLEIKRKSVKSSSDYSLSFKHKFSAYTRKVKNMMDNPIALKNYRDPQFSIPGMSASDVNFSSAGTQLAPRVQTLSRLQWYGQENELLMNQVNVDNYVYGMRGGIGIQMNHAMYRNGGVHVADVALTYSPKISISNTISFEPSVRFKMGNKSLYQDRMTDVTAVEVERGIMRDYYPDGSAPLGKDLWYKDFGAGLMVNTKWFFAGVQMDNLFRHKDNMYSNSVANPERADYHFVANVGTDWVSRKGNVRLSPYAVYQNKGPLSELWLGANFGWNKIVLGGSYSSNYDPSATIGMKFDHFAMYYNADYSISRMTDKRELSHQLTIKFTGKQSHVGNRFIKL